MPRRTFLPPSACLFLLVAVLAAALTVPVAAWAGPSYRKVSTQDPARSSWQNGIVLSLDLDTEQCERAYGNRWLQECSSRPLGAPGSRAQGIVMTPQTPGEWRWLDGDSLVFRPAGPGFLQPGTRYQIDVSQLRLPSRVQLDTRRIVYQTQPQAVRVGRESIWIDPSSAGAHGLSLPLSFIWPADTGAMERAISLVPEDPSSGLRLGETSFAWNADRDEVVVSARILRLPKKDARAAVVVEGLPAYTLYDGARTVEALRPQGLRRAFGVPGQANLFSFTSMTLTRGHDANLNARYELELTSTLRVDPGQLLKELIVCELPEKATPAATEPTDWTRLPGLGRDDLKNGRPLVPVLLSGDEPTDRVRLALPLQPNRCIAVVVGKGLASESGLTLPATVTRVLKAPAFQAELSFLQPGNLLNLAGSRKLALHSIGLDSLRWKASRIRTPFLALYAATNGFESESFAPWEDAPPMEAQTSTGTGTLALPATRDGEASFPVLDLNQLFKDPREMSGLVRLELEGFRNGEKVASASRVLLLTNMGLTVKEDADGGRRIFVQSLSSGTAVAKARVMVLGRNGTAVAEAETNAAGMAYLPPTRGLEGELEPVAVLATVVGKNTDLSWISLKDSSRVLDMGEMATRGRHGTASGLLASVFSQRGLYMPGDTLHFGILVRRFDWLALPPDMPIEAVLTDPAGRAVLKTTLQGDLSLAETSWKSSPTSPTGPYRLDVRLKESSGRGPVLGSCTVRVEDFEPDTLSLSASLEPMPDRGWIYTGPGAQPIRARVNLKTLYGEPARNHGIGSTFAVRPARLTFDAYPGYTFYDPSLAGGESRELRLPNLSTDDSGTADVTLPGNVLTGTFRGSLNIEGFEAAGGRAVSRQFEALFSPLPVVLGYRQVQEANTLSHLRQHSRSALHVLALDNTLTPTRLARVTCTLSNRRYVNSLVRDARGEFRYDASPLDKPLSTKQLDLEEKGLTIPLDTSRPGDFLLSLTGEKGETLLSVPYTVVGKTVLLPDGTSSVPLANGELHMELARTEYEPGETILLRINAPYAGTGLITIERENVVASSWFRAEAGESEQRIPIPGSFEGQGYVSVLFSRTAGSESVYMKPSAYATRSFSCGLKRRDMGLKLEAPDSVLPGSSLEVKLSAHKPGRVLLFAVDEGVLSLTGFASPNPLADLLANRALDVVTRQAFDLLMPDSERLAGRLPAFGGGMAQAGGRFLNPFRRRSEPPFARWLGMMDVGKETATVTIPVPAYLSGRIRIMAVGSSSSRNDFLTAGSASASCAVRGTLLVRPLLPLAVSPGDLFEGAVTIANTVPDSGQDAPVALAIEPDGNFELVSGQGRHALLVSENGEVTVPFSVRARDNLGSASLRFTASLAQKGDAEPLQVVRSQSLSIRPLGTSLTTESAGLVGTSREVPVERDLYAFGQDTRLTVAHAPLAAFRALAAKLQAYPFGCTEQLISRAFPWLAALQHPELSGLLFASPTIKPQDRSDIEEENLTRAMNALRSSISSQGVSLWPGGEPDDFVTAFATDYLLSLFEHGHGVPEDLRAQLLSCLESIVWQDPRDLEDARVKAYACWLLLRSGRIVTQDVERLHAWLAAGNYTWKQDVTASLLADCYAMLRLDDQATALMPGVLKNIMAQHNAFFDEGCAWALHAHILNRSFWRNNDQGRKALRSAMDTAIERSFRANASTTSMALTARTLASSIVTPGEHRPATVRCSEDAGVNPSNTRAHSVAGLDELSAPGCRRFVVHAPEGVEDLFWHLRVSGYDRGHPPAVSQGMEIHRRYLDAQGKEVKTIRAGDVVTVEIAVRSDRPLDNVAIVDILPGGLEPLLEQAPRLTGADVTHSERHEDRYLFFVHTGPERSLITYQARAITAGSFRIPVCMAQAMYEPAITASTGNDVLTVTRRN